MGRSGYLPLSEYALLGDMRTAALVSRSGSVDWLCLPRFSSPAVLCRLLDARRGGSLRLNPTGVFQASRRYVEDTSVLETDFETSRGRVRVTDFMPLHDDGRGPMVLRRVEGLSGEVELEAELWATFDFARAPSRVEAHDGWAVVRGAGQSLALRAPVRLTQAPEGGLSARWRVRAGERGWVVLTSGEAEPPPPLSDAEAERALSQALDSWRRWTHRGEYPGPYAPLLRRSALTLKLLSYAPTGAHVAAPTTSLPEVWGGVRNWDYRYTWLRDSAWVVEALVGLGYRDEAGAYLHWLESLGFKRCSISVLYCVTGGDAGEEETLEHLEGYGGARPVRVGNGAVNQVQLDVYGEIVNAVWIFLASEPSGAGMRPGLWRLVSLLADEAALRWNEKDRGIWEEPQAPQHHVNSKLLCWVAVDRALRMAERYGLPGPIAKWTEARDSLRRLLETHGFHTQVGAFTRVLGEPDMDASALLVPLFGFLPASDVRVRATVQRVREQLGAGSRLYRYRHPDGLPGREGTSPHAASGSSPRSRSKVGWRRPTRSSSSWCATPTTWGSCPRRSTPASGQMLGNYPQGLTHLSLVRAGLALEQAEQQLRRGEQPMPHSGL